MSDTPTTTGLPADQQEVLTRLLDEVATLVWYRIDIQKVNSPTLRQDGEQTDTWVDTLDNLGRPFEPEEKRTFIKFLFSMAYKMGSMVSDDIDLATIVPDQEVRQTIMHQFDLWQNKETPYQPGQPEEGWQGGRIAFLLDFFAYQIDPQIAEEEYQ